MEFKAGGDLVTSVDYAVNQCLRELLVRDGDGWLSEETKDDHTRLEARRVWVVDPLDGTREFVAGIPEWCVSIGLVEDGCAVAGGIAQLCERRTLPGWGWNGSFLQRPAGSGASLFRSEGGRCSGQPERSTAG